MTTTLKQVTFFKQVFWFIVYLFDYKKPKCGVYVIVNKIDILLSGNIVWKTVSLSTILLNF